MRLDLLHVLRALRHSAWSAAGVVGVMALVLALGAAALAIVDGVLFRPLPYPDSDRLVALRPGFDGLAFADIAGASVPDLEAWQDAAEGAVITGYLTGTLPFGQAIDDRLQGIASVLPNVFDAIGVQPAVGGFVPADFTTNAMVWPTVITHDVWVERFGADPDVLGRVVIVDPTQDQGVPSGWRHAVGLRVSLRSHRRPVHRAVRPAGALSARSCAAAVSGAHRPPATRGSR